MNTIYHGTKHENKKLKVTVEIESFDQIYFFIDTIGFLLGQINDEAIVYHGLTEVSTHINTSGDLIRFLMQIIHEKDDIMPEIMQMEYAQKEGVNNEQTQI